MQAEKIIGIRPLGQHRTIDIEVNNKNHIFYGNGIATSNSHAVSYAYDGFWAAFGKAHFARPFFTSYLYHSQNKAKQSSEVNELVNDARCCNIAITAPDFRKIQVESLFPDVNPALHFMLRNKIIYAGFSDIKGVGEAAIKKIVDKIPAVEKTLKKKFNEWEWLDFLLFFIPEMNAPVARAIIQVGAMSYMKISRTRMCYEMDALAKLTDKETEFIQKLYLDVNQHYSSLKELFAALVSCGTGKGKGISNKNRKIAVEDIITTLEKAPVSLDDSPDWIAEIERSLLGISLTCTKVDGRDTSAANCTCKEFRDGKRGYVIIAGQIQNVHEIKTKTGKDPGREMAFVTLSDTTGILDNIVAFPEAWAECRGLLVSGNIVLVGGEKGKDNSLIVKKVWQI